MRERDLRLLMAIVILTLVAIWVNLPNNPGIHIELGPIKIHRDIKVHQGLDLQGGLQVLLEADLPEDQPLDERAIAAAKVIIENRIDSLGVVEPLVQLQGKRRIIVELPGIEDPERAIATIREIGLLEFIDAGATFLPPGTVVKTTASTEGETGSPTPDEQVFTTVMTGKDLEKASVSLDQYGNPEILFALKPKGAKIFADFTAKNIGKFLAIVLDKEVISCPRIQTAIPEGQGRITGNFSLEEARSIAIQLRYGALPVPFKIVETRTIGPTLGQDSVQKSVTAGTIGLMAVLLFMLTYYRLPGLLANLALVIYALLNFALFKLIPITLTLPGITGFLLSTGMAVDANILIFERMKEELRWGRGLRAAIEAGFRRAWTSIRDSNLSTIITCAILYWFGSNFGASMVKGFAVTLFMGVVISMFTAVIVTRTFARFVFALAGEELQERKWLLGI